MVQAAEMHEVILCENAVIFLSRRVWIYWLESREKQPRTEIERRPVVSSM